MIQNLEGERQRIDEALAVLRRLHEVRRSIPAAVPAEDSPDVQKQRMERADTEEEK